MPVKKLNKTSRRKYKILSSKKSQKNTNLNNLLISLMVLVLLFLGFSYIFKSSKFDKPNFSKQVLIKDIGLKEEKLITPYPTISPKESPTPVPLTGFCLHVPVLMYHHIQPEQVAKQLGQTALTVDDKIFDLQMQYLKQNGFTTLFANELINALINHQELPQKSVVITMDDGYEDNYIYALPVLQKYSLKANIMLASGLMGNTNMLSWDEVKSLRSSGLIYFTNHTWSHYPVSRKPQSKIESEIDIAQKQIKDETGQSVNVFTYPYGEFNLNAMQTLQQKNYIGAFSEIPGTYQCDSFLMTLHRTRIGNSSLASYGI